MPETYPEFPGAQQVHAYLRACTESWGLRPHIVFDRKVLGIMPRSSGAPGWRIRSQTTRDGREHEDEFDFVVVCNGVFSTPSIPELPGRARFEEAGGFVVHSSATGSSPGFAGRDVAVVGFGKSALDLAEAALPVARSCTVICNRTLWKVPRYLFGLINSKHLILSRFAEFWLPHESMSGLRRVMHERLPRTVSLYWRLSELLIGLQLGLLSPKLRPPLRLRESTGNCFGLAPSDGFRAIRSGRLALRVGRIASLDERGLVLADGGRIAAQAIVLATGFVQQCEFLDEELRARLFGPSGEPRLYRLLVPPRIPHMAFNGYNGGGATQLTSEIGARWICALLDGRLSLPDARSMDAEIDRELAFRKTVVSAPRGLGFYSAPFMFSYLDRLLADMGLAPADRPKPIWKRYLAPIDPRDFAGERLRPLTASRR